MPLITIKYKNTYQFTVQVRAHITHPKQQKSFY